ncbi:MAG: hypothetical protein P8P66_02275 [Paracoccaceae bacterium]|jgi:hypothetical protein|nr:hypothetical protein [Paracoccaceae bacterium]
MMQMINSIKMAWNTMKVTFHLGAPRTGVGSLHSYLSETPVSGTTLWTPEQTRNGVFSGLFCDPSKVEMAIEHRGRRSCGRLQVALHDLQAAGQDHLLVSDPKLLGSAKGFFPNVTERMMRFRDGVRGHSVTLALSVRSYSSFWNSVLGSDLSTNVTDRLTTHPRRWRNVITDMYRAMPDAQIIVWPFERMVGAPHQLVRVLTGYQSNSTSRPLVGRSGSTNSFSTDQRACLDAEYAADLDWLRSGASGIARFVDTADIDKIVAGPTPLGGPSKARG